MVGLWAEVLAGDGAEFLGVRCEVILGRHDSPAVGSGPVRPSFQASINFSKDCIKYSVSLLVSAIFRNILGVLCVDIVLSSDAWCALHIPSLFSFSTETGIQTPFPPDVVSVRLTLIK